ncbi:MAG TPA: hypothetical protein VJX66_08550, partial [Amycolatopsis sp.]|nr:hypothetical protein [Amycolatopsis sp.]
ELTHTPGMRVPHDRLRIQVLRHWSTGTGLAFTGVLALDGAPIAAIRDDGDGTGARLDVADGEPGWPGMDKYLAGRGAQHTIHPQSLSSFARTGATCS